MFKIRYIVFGLLSFIFMNVEAQSLLDMLNEENAKKQDTIYAEGTFKSTRIINGQSIETSGKHMLNMMISHRFGNVDAGAYDLWGLDQSYVRIGFEYGIHDRVDIGIGRSSDLKLIDSYIKWNVWRQSSGALHWPVSLTFYSNMAVSAQKWVEPNRDNKFSSRMNYAHQMMIAQKVNSKFSYQLGPGLVHRNLVVDTDTPNDVGFMNFSARYKLSERFAISAEYYYLIQKEVADVAENSFSIGVDIETGGHVFQLHFSNNRGMTEVTIPNNKNNWFDSEFGFGFNIKRQFNLKPKPR